MKTFYNIVPLESVLFNEGLLLMQVKWVTHVLSIQSTHSSVGSDIIQLLHRDIYHWLESNLVGSMFVWSVEDPPLING